MHTKTLGPLVVKDADAGTVEAVFSTFGVVDKDGDVTGEASFTAGAPVVISDFNHSSWKGARPVGRGAIEIRDGEAVMVGQYFMDTDAGRDAFLVVKALSDPDQPGGAIQEWSYGLLNVKSSRTTVDGRSARMLDSIDVPEVSPVLVGAGTDTRTLAVKAAAGETLKVSASVTASALRDAGRERWGDDATWIWLEDWDPDASKAVFSIEADDEAGRLVQVSFEGDGDGDGVALGDAELDVRRVVSYAAKSATFLGQAASVVTDVAGLVSRAGEVRALRAEKGKTISPASAGLLSELAAAIKQLEVLLVEDPSSGPSIEEEVGAEYARFVGRSTKPRGG